MPWAPLKSEGAVECGRRANNPLAAIYASLNLVHAALCGPALTAGLRARQLEQLLELIVGLPLFQLDPHVVDPQIVDGLAVLVDGCFHPLVRIIIGLLSYSGLCGSLELRDVLVPQPAHGRDSDDERTYVFQKIDEGLRSLQVVRNGRIRRH